MELPYPIPRSIMRLSCWEATLAVPALGMGSDVIIIAALCAMCNLQCAIHSRTTHLLLGLYGSECGWI